MVVYRYYLQDDVNDFSLPNNNPYLSQHHYGPLFTKSYSNNIIEIVFIVLPGFLHPDIGFYWAYNSVIYLNKCRLRDDRQSKQLNQCSLHSHWIVNGANWLKAKRYSPTQQQCTHNNNYFFFHIVKIKCVILISICSYSLSFSLFINK